MKKELSGLFLSPARFQASLEELRSSACEVHWIRIFHNQPQHIRDLLTALASGNTSVEHLDIHEVDDGLGCSSLQDFLASPTSTCRPVALTINTISCKAAAAVGQGLASASCQVSELSLNQLPDAALAAVLQPLASCTDPNRILRRLTLVKCIIGAATAQYLHVLSHLSHLSFTDCVMSDAHGEQFIHTLTQHNAMDTTTTHLPPSSHPAGLESLTLTGSHAGPLVSRAVSDLLLSPSPSTLRHLCLNDSVGLGDNGACLLAAGLTSNTTLTTLLLSHCGIGTVGAKALASALAVHPCLETLALNDNHIGSEGFMAILLGLSAGKDAATASVLQRLQLEGNSIKGTELPTWPAGQQLQPHLQALLLARNQLSDAGAGLLQQVFSTCPAGQVLQLDLTCNAVGPVGAAQLVQLLQQQQAMEELKLDSNRLHDAGAAVLLPAVSGHPCLRVFRVDHCRVLDLELKTKITEVTQILAARLRRQGSSGSDGSDAPRPIRIGTRFPPQDYVVQGDGSVMSSPEAPAPSNGARPIRMGSRFPPHVYARSHMVEEEDREGAGGAAQGGSASCGKHVLGAEERAEDPRASKVHEGTSKAIACGGGGGSGGDRDMHMSPFGARAWHHGSPAGDSSVARHGASLGAAMMLSGSCTPQGAKYPERYSMDLPTTSSLASMDTTTDPWTHHHRGNMTSMDTTSACSRDTTTCTPQDHTRVVSSKSVDLPSNRAGPGGLMSTQSCGLHQQPSTTSGQTYLVVRPSLRKKALTPEQQAVFHVF